MDQIRDLYQQMPPFLASAKIYSISLASWRPMLSIYTQSPQVFAVQLGKMSPFRKKKVGAEMLIFHQRTSESATVLMFYQKCTEHPPILYFSEWLKDVLLAEMTQASMRSFNSSVHPGSNCRGFSTRITIHLFWAQPLLDVYWIFTHMHFKYAALSIFVQYMGTFQKEKEAAFAIAT